MDSGSSLNGGGDGNPPLSLKLSTSSLAATMQKMSAHPPGVASDIASRAKAMS